MTTQEKVSPQNETVDVTITRSARALNAWHRIPVELLAEAVHTSKSTIERRLKAGGWTAREVAAVAWAFGVSVDQLYSGAVDFNASQWLGSPVDPTAPRDGAGRPPTLPKVAHQRRLVSVSASPRRQTSLSVSRPRLQLITA